MERNKFSLLSILCGVLVFALASCSSPSSTPNSGDSSSLSVEATLTKVIVGTRIPITVKLDDKQLYKGVSLVNNDRALLIEEGGKLFVIPTQTGDIEVQVTNGKEVSKPITIKSIYSTMPEGQKKEGIYHLTTNYFKECVWNYDDYSTEIIARVDKPALIKFTAKWCKPCQEYNEMMHKIAQEYDGRAYVLEVDIDLNRTPYEKTRKAFNPSIKNGIPLFIFIAPGEKATYDTKTSEMLVKQYFDSHIK